MIVYTVAAIFEDAAVAQEWIAWLRGGHLAEVMDGGALDAEVIRLDATAGSSATRYEVRYHFAGRESFTRYERDHAPRLRAEGLAKFPPQRGVRYERSVGERLVSQRSSG
jgi:Domain of unknown function (DUF4286)